MKDKRCVAEAREKKRKGKERKVAWKRALAVIWQKCISFCLSPREGKRERERKRVCVCVWDEEPELDLVRREWACSYSLSYDQRFYTSCDRLLLSKSLEVDPDSASSFLVIRLPANIAGKYSPAVCLMFLTPFSCWWLRAI